MAIVNINQKFGIYNIRSTNGDNRLGGNNLDTRLVDYCVDDLKKDALFLESDKETLIFLRNACERAKKELSTKDETDVVIDWFDNQSYKVFVTRNAYENMIQDYVDRSIDCVKQAIKDAQLCKEQINKIVLVGGTTYIPIIQTTLRQFFEAEINISMNPHEAGKQNYIN